MKKNVLIVVIFGLVFLGILIYLSMGLSGVRVEVCVEFNGQQSCRTASGPNREDAQRKATENACAFVASGMTDSMACTGRPPVKITWLGQ